jgi:nitroreductase/dihydropteridine reductase
MTNLTFKQIVEQRYATKKFDGKTIPQEKVDELLELIRLAPSSFNIQPWKIKIVTDQKTKEKLLSHSWNQHQITTCSRLLVFCANTDVKGNIDLLRKTMIENGADPEQIKGYIDMMSGFEQGMDEERKLAWASKQTYLALSNALNGAKSLGFDSCPMEGFDSSAYSKELNLPKNLIPVVLCPIGYAADTQKPKIRFKKEEIFF